MIEGWNGDDYLVIFEKSEWAAAENRYAFSALLPGLTLMGLRGWDDFIVRDSEGRTYSIPTVPVDREYLTPYALPELEASLTPDARFIGKIKWYLKPIAFGGDPNPGPNLTWVNHEQHGQLVKSWNEKYRALRGKRHEN